MKKLIAISIVVSLILFSARTFAQVGVGLTSYSIELRGNTGDVNVYSLGVINPSSYTIRVTLYPSCTNCTQEVKLFGLKLFEKVESLDEYFTLTPNEVMVPPNTPPETAVNFNIKFAPKLFFKKYLKFYTPEWLNWFIRAINKNYKDSFQIPYFTILIGEKSLAGSINAQVVSYDGLSPGVMPVVGATLYVIVSGMPFLSFLFIVIVVIIIILLIVRRILKSKEE